MTKKRKRPKEPGTELKKEEKYYLMTMTGEPFLLARIHFEVFNRRGIAKIFSRLKCMDYDPDQKRWVWLYDGEARKLHFNWSYSSIPKEKHPIVLGSFFSRFENEMFLNVNSFDRATRAIVFFDRYFRKGLIRNALAKVTDIEVVNKYFTPSPGGGSPRHEDYFDKQPVSKTDPEAFLNKLKTMVSSAKDRDEGIRQAFSYLEDSAKEPFPEIERLPTHFYEDGIEGLKANLRMRQAVAYQHWLGNTDYSCYDLVQERLRHAPETTR